MSRSVIQYRAIREAGSGMMDRPWSETNGVKDTWRSALVGVATGSILSFGVAGMAASSLLRVVANQPVRIQNLTPFLASKAPSLKFDRLPGLSAALAQEAYIVRPDFLAPISIEGATRKEPKKTPEQPQQRQAARLLESTPERSGDPGSQGAVVSHSTAIDPNEISALDLDAWHRHRQARLSIDLDAKQQREVRDWISAWQTSSWVGLGADLGDVTLAHSWGNVDWFIEARASQQNSSEATVQVSYAAPKRKRVTEAASLAPVRRPKLSRTEPGPARTAQSEAPIDFVQAGSVLASRDATNSEAFTARATPAVTEKESIETLALDTQKLNSQTLSSSLEETHVDRSRSDVWSYEGWAHRSRAGWIVTTAQDFWPTLSYRRAGTSKLPKLTSQREASILAALTGARLEATAGLVVGDIPAGYLVEFSGRAEEAVYWRSREGHLDTHDYSAPRSFALVNAEPGMQVVHLVHAWTGERIPVAAAIVGGYSTYLNLSEVRKVELRGRIAQASAKRFDPVAGAQVSRVGDAQSRVASQKNGEFKLPHLIVAGELPLYIEFTSGQSPHPHRFKVELSQGPVLSVGDLFSVSASRVGTWVSQLDGGVSSESGMILSAWSLSSRNLESKLPSPVVFPVESSTELEPETYFINSEEELQVEGQIARGTTRTLTTQVVQGLHKFEVRLPNVNESVWSEIAVTSPGVITILRSGYAQE